MPPAIGRGFIVLKKEMRSGYTTGACAAAALKAALIRLTGTTKNSVEISALSGERICIPIESVTLTTAGASAKVIKDAGDDPDITNGMPVLVEAKPGAVGSGIKFVAGPGVGTVTKGGLSVPVGEPAINPGPRTMMQQVVQEILGEQADCEITISLPAGTELAQKTLNPVLGIEGGLSIIGTTGIVRPMSEEGFKNSLSPQIDVAKSAGFDSIVFVPGKIGETIARDKCNLPPQALIQTSNFIGHMLECAVERKIRQVMLFGHIGKISKIAAGIFYTHNRIADARLETLAAYAGAMGMPAEGIEQVLAATTTEAALPIINGYGLQGVYQRLARRASERAERYVFHELTIGTVLLTLQGEILAMDETASAIGRDLGWNIK